MHDFLLNMYMVPLWNPVYRIVQEVWTGGSLLPIGAVTVDCGNNRGDDDDDDDNLLFDGRIH